MTDKVSIEISKDLYIKASQKVDNVTSYLEVQLMVLVNDEFGDEYQIMKEISNKINEIQELEARLSNLRDNRVNQVIDNRIFEEAIVTIARIHDALGMIGKNQIKSIAKRNSVPYDALLSYVEEKGFNVVNYTGVKK